MGGSDFQQNKPQRCKIGIRNEVKTFYFGDHIRTWIVISKKKVFTLFSNQLVPRGFSSFSKSSLSCEKVAHPWSMGFPSFPAFNFPGNGKLKTVISRNFGKLPISLKPRKSGDSISSRQNFPFCIIVAFFFSFFFVFRCLKRRFLIFNNLGENLFVISMTIQDEISRCRAITL